MKKNHLKGYSVAVAGLLSILTLASCGGGGDSSSVAPSSTAPQPSVSTSSPDRESSSLPSSPEESSISVDTSQPVVSFYLNDGTETLFTQYNFTANRRITLPDEDPQREGYVFTGWFTDPECTTPYDQTSRPTESFSLYAGWMTAFTMEAEYTDFTNKAGMGYSSNVIGTDMIVKDNGTANASNGFYVSYLYYNGATLDFDFTAEEAVEDAYLVVRLSSEFYDIFLNDENYRIVVNGEDLTGFNFDLSGALSVSTEDKRPFTNFTVTTTLSLPQGENRISLIVDNNDNYGGTMRASAPLVDCIYIGTESELSWEPKTDNLKNK